MLITEIKQARLKRIEAEYVNELVQPKITELKQQLQQVVPAIQNDLINEMESIKQSYKDNNADIQMERFKNEVEQAKIKLMNKQELVDYARNLDKQDVTAQVLSELKLQSEKLNANDVLFEMRIDELKPYALYPYMRDTNYLDMEAQSAYIDSIATDLLNGTLHFEDGTTSNIDSALSEWISKQHYNDPEAEFKSKEAWESFI